MEKSEKSQKAQSKLKSINKLKNNNNNMLQILSGVFKVILLHHLQPEEQRKPLSIELKAAGISEDLIQKSLLWLQRFFSYSAQDYEKVLNNFNHSHNRIFAPQELARIGVEGQNFLTELSSQHILAPAKREFLMDCIMGEDIDPLSLPQLQFLTFMVLSQDCKRAEEIRWLEEIVLKQHSELTTLAN
jgi:Smg protein